MGRFVGVDNFDNIISNLQEVFYVDDNGNKIYFKFINIEQLSLKQFKDRYPDEEINEPIFVIDTNEWRNKIFYTLKVIICHQAAIDDFQLQGYNKNLNNNVVQIDYDKFIIKFGKYRGTPIKKISEKDIGYIDWLLNTDNIDVDTRTVCEYWINIRN